MPLPRNSSHAVAYSNSASMHTRVFTFGRSPRISLTSGSYAALKISTEQSKRSRTSRFSAAPLRGLIGHHTAPARDMPNTVVNATGSFEESTATVSPGSTPCATSADATRFDSSMVSP